MRRERGNESFNVALCVLDDSRLLVRERSLRLFFAEMDQACGCDSA